MPAYTQADLNSYFASLQALGPQQVMFIGNVPMRYLAGGQMAPDPLWVEMTQALDTRGGDVFTGTSSNWNDVIANAGGLTNLNTFQQAAGYPGFPIGSNPTAGTPPANTPPAPPAPPPPIRTPPSGPPPVVPPPVSQFPGNSMPPGSVGPAPVYPPNTPSGPPPSGFYNVNPIAPIGSSNSAGGPLGTANQSLPGAPWTLGGSWAGTRANPNTTFPWNAPRGFANWNPLDPRANPNNAFPTAPPPPAQAPAPPAPPAPAPSPTTTTPNQNMNSSGFNNIKSISLNPMPGLNASPYSPRAYADTYSTGVQLPFNNAFQQAMLSTLSPQAIYPTFNWQYPGSYGPQATPIRNSGGGLLGGQASSALSGLLGGLSGK